MWRSWSNGSSWAKLLCNEYLRSIFAILKPVSSNCASVYNTFRISCQANLKGTHDDSNHKIKFKTFCVLDKVSYFKSKDVNTDSEVNDFPSFCSIYDIYSVSCWKKPK
mmetsp:Transcript_7054/g.10492  ORF Transcript_7054/g.10492 Transcript_7054/m.10492 type:complete len:108 (+) Transcript_7054:180-503(+)